MGEAKRRKQILGDKYGDPEYSNTPKITPEKILDDLSKNPQRERWMDIIYLFIYDNWHPDFLSDLSDSANDLKVSQLVSAELSKWGESNRNRERTIPINTNSMENILKCLFVSAELLNEEESPFKIDFKQCKTDSTDLTKVLFLISLSIRIFHQDQHILSEAA